MRPQAIRPSLHHVAALLEQVGPCMGALDLIPELMPQRGHRQVPVITHLLGRPDLEAAPSAMRHRRRFRLGIHEADTARGGLGLMDRARYLAEGGVRQGASVGREEDELRPLLAVRTPRSSSTAALDKGTRLGASFRPIFEDTRPS